ncbi:MAG: type 1 periplasmic binding fold superfamily protein [Gemmatimonadetes bacterium]|nr:type 1 periplasmic binding fold superfamily protein [Gemmatimonadota bacterium]
MRTLARSLAAACAATVMAACGKSSTAPGGESEVISRVTLTLTPPTGAPLTAFIDDSDGSGPTAPSAQQGTLALARGVTYAGTVKFENRLVSPVVDITGEVQAEANAHRVFYSSTNSALTITTTDTDGQGRPLGLRFTLAAPATAAAGSAPIRVVLCHYDSAPKTAAATSCAGETDIDLTFAASIAP